MLGFLIFMAVFLLSVYVITDVIQKKLMSTFNVAELTVFTEMVAWFSATGMVVAFIGCLQLLAKAFIFVLMLFL